MAEANTEYVLHYTHEGQSWTLSFFAADAADATRKVQSVRTTLELKGRLLGRGDTLEEAAEAAGQTQAEEALRSITARARSPGQ